jgi:hypothetical protein
MPCWEEEDADQTSLLLHVQRSSTIKVSESLGKREGKGKEK